MEEVFSKMCRLMGYVSQAESSFPAQVGKDFEEFIALSSVHCDGWGIATNDRHQGHTVLEKKVEAAAESATFQKVIADNAADGALLHLRWATRGIAISENNTHPFVYGDYSFIHNGSIFPPDSFSEFIDKKFTKLIVDDSDSERYFYLMMGQIEKMGLKDGIKTTLAIIKEHGKTTSLNFMLMNSESFVIGSEHDSAKKPEWAPDDYYVIKYKKNDEGVLFASSGWNQPGWHVLENHHMAIVDRSTSEIEVINL
jgi:predicted glutamine amidotransferase